MPSILSLGRTLAAALLLTLTPAFAEDHPEGLHIHDAYARVNGGAGGNGAVFFLVHNNTGTDEKIVAARSPAAEKAELHTHTMTADGVMQMREIEGGVPLPAGEMHVFERGADHVMLMGLTSDLKDGDVIAVTLILESGAEVTFDAVLDSARMPGQGGMDGHMNHSEGHDHTHGHSMGDDQQGMDAGSHDQSGHGHGHAAAAPDTTGLPDAEAIITILKAQFETPESPLAVDPVVVEGDHALASWAQDDRGGRALLERRDGTWVVVLCGGEDLRLPAFLEENGVTAAETLSSLYNAAEEALGTDKVALSSSFEGIVVVAGSAP